MGHKRREINGAHFFAGFQEPTSGADRGGRPSVRGSASEGRLPTRHGRRLGPVRLRVPSSHERDG